MVLRKVSGSGHNIPHLNWTDKLKYSLTGKRKTPDNYHAVAAMETLPGIDFLFQGQFSVSLEKLFSLQFWNKIHFNDMEGMKKTVSVNLIMT